MGVVVAIVGRRLVGKSLLAHHILSQKENIQLIPLNTNQDYSLLFAQEGNYIVEIPSDVPIHFWDTMPWHAIIVVDCPDNYQRQYGKICNHNLYSREMYMKVATDVFLNTVALDHVEWVAKQLVRSYFITE